MMTLSQRTLPFPTPLQQTRKIRKIAILALGMEAIRKFEDP